MPGSSPKLTAKAAITIRVVTHRELASESWEPGWEDPDGIAALSPEKRRALVSNPFARDEAPAQVIGLQGTRVIGRMDVIPGLLTVRGEPAPILWTSHLTVPPEFRDTLMGILIIVEYQSLNDIVAACAVSRMVHPIYEKFEWRDFQMPRYLLLRRSAAVIRRYVGQGALSGAVRVLADAALLGQRGWLRAWAALRTSHLRCAAEAAMAEDLDPLLKDPGKPIATFRSAALVNWMLNNSFHNDPRDRRGLFYIRDRQGNLLAYFLATARFHEQLTHRNLRDVLLGSLKDWLIFDRDRVSLSQLVLLALRVFAEWNVDAVEVCLPDPKEISLRRWGFLRVGELNLMVKIGDDSLLRYPELGDPGAWWFRPADGDNVFG